ncbi:MAG: DUF4831 family protein [Lentimicrobiaceae bacterium]
MIYKSTSAMYKKAFLFFLLIISISGINAQINVNKVGSSGIPSVSDGLFYSLPQTVIQVDIIVKKIQKVKGPFAEYANQMLGLSMVTSSNSTEYELKDVRLTSFTEPDPTEYYFIQIPEKQKDRKAIELFLTDEGVISGIGTKGKITKDQNERSINLSSSGIDIPEFANPSVVERTDTVIKRISLDSTNIEQKFFRKTSAVKSVEQKAREAAEFILKLDESIYNLINGYQEVNYDKGAMEFMYNQMNSMKKDYLELFKGVTSISNETFSFYYIAHKDDPSETLCRFSISKGILPITSASGDLVQMEATSLNKTHLLKSETEKLAISQRDSHGIFYRIPEKAIVAFKVGGQVKLETRFVINQLGVVTFLPASSLRNISIDNNTGTLRRVVLE